MIRAVLAALALLLATGDAAWAAPAGVAVMGFLTAGFTASVAATVGTFLIRTAIVAGLNLAVNKLFGPKVPKGGAQAAQERQASVLGLAIGESPREVIFGEAATGGSLAGAFNYGGQHGTDWVVKVIILADHRCHALQGFYVNDTFVSYFADGAVGAYNGQLEVYWRDGAAGQAFPAALMSAWRSSPLHSATAPASDTPYTGQAYVVVAYKADAPDSQNPTWSGSHPQFLWVVRGKRCYDPRKDSTVGGAGAHRWDDPDTWEWTQNGPVCRYNWVRGIYALDQVGDPAQLLVGRGLTAVEAPPERVFAYANLADELVDDGKGGTEIRYAVNGVIRATDQYLAVEEMFAAAMAGRIIQPDGGVEVEPGQAKTPVFAFTDADLLMDFPVEFGPFGSDADRVNTVIPRYVEPGQRWQDHAGPVRRDLADLAMDGGPREETLPLSLVTSSGQAQRVAEIRRKAARLERTAKVVLGPRFSQAEAGDWVQWTSARYTKGQPVVFRIVAHAQDAGWRNTWALEEVSFDVYGFGGAPLPPGEGPAPVTPPDGLVLSGVTVEAIEIEGSTGAIVPAIRFGWDTPVDPAVTRIRAEVRALGQTQAAPTMADTVNSGELVTTNGVAPNLTLQGRLVPLGAPGRPVVPSDWVTVSTGNLVASDSLGFAGVSPEAIQQAITDALRLAEAVSEQALKQSQVVEALRRLNLTPDGLPLGAFAADQKLRTDRTIEDIALIGVRNALGTVFNLSRTSLAIDGELLGEKLDVLAAETANAFAQILQEASLRIAGDEANADLIESVTASVNGHTATLLTHASAIAGLEGRTEASYEIVAAAGGDPAYAKLVATQDGSGIALAAQELALFNFFGGALVRVLRLVDGKAFFAGPVSIDLGPARLTLGPGFGAANDLIFWFGPNTVAVESMTKTNGRWAFASDLRAYYGNAELQTGGGLTITLTGAPASSVGFGAGPRTTNTVVANVSGGTAPYTFAWSYVNGDLGLTINNPSSAGTSFSGTVGAGESLNAMYSVLVMDAAGKSGVALCAVNIVEIS